MSRHRSIDDGTVLDRALELFWQHGYADTSMRDLTRATGLGSAALYHRFTGKDGLFMETVRRYADRRLHERLSRLTELDEPLEAISRFFDEIVSLSVDDRHRRGCFLVNTAVDGADMSEAARSLVRDRLSEVEAFFRGRLELARERGQLAPDLQPDVIAETLFGTMLAIRVLARLQPDENRLRRLADCALTPLLPDTLAAKDCRP